MPGKPLFVAAFLAISFHLYSQESVKNSFGISAGIGKPDVISFTGGGAVDGKTLEVGFNYYRQLTRKIKLESGLVWHRNQFTTSTDNPPFPSYHYTQRYFMYRYS